MVVRHIVEELLGIKSTTKKQGKVSIRRLDDESNPIDGLPSIEGILVGQTVFDTLCYRHAQLECFRHARQ
jgi:hypothetical protein